MLATLTTVSKGVVSRVIGNIEGARVAMAAVFGVWIKNPEMAGEVTWALQVEGHRPPGL
jgi:hypothetical protein